MDHVTTLAAAADALCALIDDMDPEIEAFVPEPGRRERLLAQAREAEQRWPDPAGRPPLFGVPVAVKDIVRVDGLPTLAGSDVPPHALAGPQATVVTRLLRAGALIAGKTVTAEFAVGAPGPTRNPRDPSRTPGGSSSGSAAAVAAGMVPLAVGTQTVGSVVRPAAYCGVTGFRPTHGRVPVDGVLPNAPSFDAVGLFTADVASAAFAASVVCDGWRPAPDRARPPVLGVPAGPYLEQAGAVARDAFAAQVEALRSAGCPVRELPFLPDFDRLRISLKALNRYELARSHAELFPRYGHRYRRETAAAVREGLAVTDRAYAAAVEARREMADRIDTLAGVAGLDGWIAPSATGPAPRGLGFTGDPVMSLPWSAAGLPAVSVPAGTAPDGMPLGLQCVGPRGADEHLLCWAAGVEGVLAAGA